MNRNEIESWNANRIGQPEVLPGDVLVVHSRHNEVTNITVREGESFQNRYGRFEHKDLIGKTPGRRWVTSSSKVVTTGAGFVIALKPTPELWSQALLHRTQIVYTHDIAVILMEMDLRPGGVVVEAGTGSGSMTASLARSVAPDGRVLTFENHRKRAQTAADEFVKLGLSSVVSVVHRDVVSDGFRGVPDSSVDAIFLDLPSVWDLIPEAERVLRADGVLALFSPCIEQVQKSYEVIRRYQFGELKTITTRCRSWETRPR